MINLVGRIGEEVAEISNWAKGPGSVLRVVVEIGDCTSQAGIEMVWLFN